MTCLTDAATHGTGRLPRALSGCGKSIFLRIIAGHTGLDSGEVQALTFFTPLPVLTDDVGLVFGHLA